jgi:hypothetical protein
MHNCSYDMLLELDEDGSDLDHRIVRAFVNNVHVGASGDYIDNADWSGLVNNHTLVRHVTK